MPKALSESTEPRKPEFPEICTVAVRSGRALICRYKNISRNITQPFRERAVKWRAKLYRKVLSRANRNFREIVQPPSEL